MPYAINERDFADPANARSARGEARDKSGDLWLDPKGKNTIPIANGGMIDPQRYDIAPDTPIYRFASYTDGVTRVMKGGWWLEQKELNHIVNYAERNKKTLGYVVRLLCVVPPEWGSDLNFLIRVRTAGVVAAWRGLANSAYASMPLSPSSSTMVTTRITARNDVASMRINQLFIPGTRSDGGAAAMFRYEGQWQTEGARDWIYGSGS